MGRKGQKGRAVKRNKEAGKGDQEDPNVVNAPHSFVIHRGKNVGKSIQELTSDLRQVMEPFTASNVKVRPKNVIKDFVHVAGLLKVSHLIMLTKTEKSPYLKIGKFPRGPTMTFKIQNYALSRDVRSSLKRQVTYDKQFSHHALLIMNNFSGKDLPENDNNVNGKESEIPLGCREIELMSTVFQNMFPSINVTTIKLNQIRRCVILNFNSQDGTVDFRHYTIKVVPVGVSRQVKKATGLSKKVPNLSRYESVSDYLEAGQAAGSESELEADENSRVVLSQDVASRGNMVNQQSSIRLIELGPRLTLEPVKIEEGLLDGDILYHKLMVKTPEEKEKIKLARKMREKEKAKRRKEQADNVKRKQREKEAHKERSLAGMKKSNAGLPEGFKSAPDSSPSEDEEDDDAEWYRKEVGENPDKDLFEKDAMSGSRKRKFDGEKRFSVPKRFKKNVIKRTSSSIKSRDEIRTQKKRKRPLDTFNNQGIGPNFDKTKKNKGPRVTSAKRRKKNGKK